MLSRVEHPLRPLQAPGGKQGRERKDLGSLPLSASVVFR